jgi:hypothetical protein
MTKIYGLLVDLDIELGEIKSTENTNYTLRAMFELVTALMLLTHQLDEIKNGGE